LFGETIDITYEETSKNVSECIVLDNILIPVDRPLGVRSEKTETGMIVIEDLEEVPDTL